MSKEQPFYCTEHKDKLVPKLCEVCNLVDISRKFTDELLKAQRQEIVEIVGGLKELRQEKYYNLTRNVTLDEVIKIIKALK